MSHLRVLLACECSGRVRDEFAKRNWEAWSADLLPSENPCAVTVLPSGATMKAVPAINAGHYQGPVQDLFSWNHPVNAGRKNELGTLDDRDCGGCSRCDDMPLWDLIVAFPPCTRLSYAGNRWRKEWQENGEEDAGADLFMEMINAPSDHVAVENPRGVMFTRYRKPDQTIQPWWFGDPFKKNTCLWLKGLPELEPEYDEPAVLASVVSGDLKGYRLHRVTTGGGSSRTDAGVPRPEHDFNGRQHYEDSEGRKNRAKVRSRTFPGIARAMAEQWGSYVESLESLG